MVFAAGCANKVAAPIAQKTSPPRDQATVHRHGAEQLPPSAKFPAHYVVRSGDTLHSIAWRYRLDYRQLARWNRLSNPNLIFAGQKLRLSAPAKTKTMAKSSTSRAPKRQTGNAKPASKTQFRSAGLRWTWPATGSVQPATSALGTKGIEILGKRGQPVKAAAAGRVVYSGSGLRGYGRLIIIKHSEEFLSAYAHNERLLVAEGSTVKSGESIAEMGDSEAKTVMLHFEIRRDGKAVEPLKLLPRR
jgi:lipoprotein NlpD